MMKNALKANKPQKKQQQQQHKKSVQKVQKKKIATKKVVQKKSIVAAKKITTTTTTPTMIARSAMSTMITPTSTLPSQFSFNLPQQQQQQQHSFVRSANVFKKTMKQLNDEVATANATISPAKVIFQAQKHLQNDANTLSKELNPANLDRDLAEKGFSYKVNDEGVITLMQKKHGYNVEFVFDREFEFAEQDEEDENGENRNNDEEGGDEGKYAFHNITVTLSKTNWGSLRLGGQLHLNGDMKIQTFTPYQQNGTELRTVSTEDLSDAAVNAIFDALEVVCLSDEACLTVIEIGRQERLKTHLQSIDWMVSFFNQADGAM